MSKDRIEFYCDGKLLVGIDSSIVPAKGSYINIAKQTYRVSHVSYSIDHSASLTERSMRCNVELVREGA